MRAFLVTIAMALLLLLELLAGAFGLFCPMTAAGMLYFAVLLPPSAVFGCAFFPALLASLLFGRDPVFGILAAFGIVFFVYRMRAYLRGTGMFPICVAGAVSFGAACAATLCGTLSTRGTLRFEWADLPAQWLFAVLLGFFCTPIVVWSFDGVAKAFGFERFEQPSAHAGGNLKKHRFPGEKRR